MCPPGLTIADTVVQDVAFVLAAVFFAQLGGRSVSAWQFGLRPTRRGAGDTAAAAHAARLPALQPDLGGVAVTREKEKLLEQLGTGESTTLLLLSAALTCVIAPICEEFLFRGFIFTALRNWRGTWPAAVITGLIFGGVHAGSAPAVDLVPLAGAGLRPVPALPLHGIAVSVHRGALAEQLARVRQPRGLGLADPGADDRRACGHRPRRRWRSNAPV